MGSFLRSFGGSVHPGCRADWWLSLGFSLAALLFVTPVHADLRAGAAKVSITPNPQVMPYPLGGYVAPERLKHNATGIQDPCFARALVLANGEAKCALVSLDLCFLPASARAAVLPRIQRTGIPRAAVFLAATHTHSAPDPLLLHRGNTGGTGALPGFDPKLLDWFADRIGQAIVEANERLRPARIGSAQAQNLAMNRNRRDEKLTDDEMTLLKVTDANGKPLAVVVNYAAHPTCFGPSMLRVSGDWSGALEQKLETLLPGAVALFLNGAEGDASVSGAEGATPEERIESYSDRMLSHVLALYAQTATSGQVSLSAWEQPVALGAPKAHPFFLLGAAQFRATPDQARAYVRRMMPTTSRLTFLRIGNALFMGYPGEPTATLGLEAKRMARAAGVAHPAVVALTNDWLGYLVSAEQYRTGKYESTMSFYGETIGSKMQDGVQAGLSRLAPAGRRPEPAYSRDQAKTRSGKGGRG